VAAIVWADVTAIAPELVSIKPAAQGIILAEVNTALDVTVFGKLGEDSPKLKLARIYLAAHLASVGPVLGIVSKEVEGGLEIDYMLPPIPVGDDPFYYRTGYGAGYRSIIRSTRARLPYVPGLR